MKQTILTLLLGLGVGLATYVGYSRHYAPASADSLEGQLVWMKSELRLSNEQFAAIKSLHQASHPRLQAMAAQLAQMQAEFTVFEQTRKTSDKVDFLEFARFIENRRDLNRACLDSTKQLVLASAQVMDPQQRQRYLNFVTTADPLVGTLPN